MNHWLAISNRDNSDIITRRHIWGVPKRFANQIGRTRSGDTLLVYVGQQIIDKDNILPPAITGCYEIISETYEDTSRIFTAPPKLGDEIFPLRITLRPIKIFYPPIEFKPLIPKLNFIINKMHWSGHIRGQAMRTIPEEDYLLIMNQK